MGTVRDVYANPATPFVGSFLGSVNEFQGHVEGGNIRIGDDLLPGLGQDQPNGKPVLAFARPHELEIVAERSDPAVGVPAKVHHIPEVGAVARVGLMALNQLKAGHEPTHFEVELASQRFSELAFVTGQSVQLVSRQSRIFEPGAPS